MATGRLISGFHLSSPSRDQFLEKYLAAALLATLLARLFLACIYEINWDEFYILSLVHNFTFGRYLTTFQTFQVHFFQWLSLVSVNEAVQVVAARFVMLALQVATCWLLFQINRKFFSKAASIFAVLAYASFSYVIWQGASFRADPMATFLLIASLYSVLCRPPSLLFAALTGLLMAIAAMITIKSVFYVPTIGIALLALWWESKWSRERFFYGAACALSAAVFMVLLYLAHKLTLQTEIIGPSAFLGASYGKTVNFSTLFPGFGDFLYSLLPNLAFWCTSFYGLWLAARSLLKNGVTARGLIILSMAIPLLSLFFYRNGFPYYYTFILAPFCVFCACAWDEMNARLGDRAYKFIPVALIALCATNVLLHAIIKPVTKTLFYQKEIIDIVHKAFPEPVPYIDRCSMIAAFPQAGFFMDSWGIEDYSDGRKASLANEIRKKQPVFLLVNILQLDYQNIPPASVPLEYRLPDEDLDILKNNYIPYWGPIHIAGKTFEPTASVIDFEIQIAGAYTITADAPVTIDGPSYKSGDVAYLTAGYHTMSTPQPVAITLTWGRNLYKPDYPPPEKQLFNGF